MTGDGRPWPRFGCHANRGADGRRERIEIIIGIIIHLIIAAWLIYDPEALGEYTGAARGHYINKTTPGCMLRAIGCCMVAAPSACLLGGLIDSTGLPLWASMVPAVILGLAGAVGLYTLAVRLFG